MSYKRYSNHLFEFAEIMLFALDVPPHLQGFLFLAEAVAIRAKDKRSRFKAIYARIAATYGISRKTVSSAMSYAIFYSPDVLCATLRTTRGELFIGKVISSLALFINCFVLDPTKPT